MTHPNISLLYYKHYFSEIDWSKTDTEEVIELIKANNIRIQDQPLVIEDQEEIPGSQFFRMESVYPGLLTGSGISHEAGIEGEFKLGLHLDHTSGLPVIYGSSVKGVLRSAFETTSPETGLFDFGYIRKFLPAKPGEWKDDEIMELAREIFKGEEKDEKNNWRNKSIYRRDIFFEAKPVASKDKHQRILASDALAPHGDNSLKNPIPIPFLKVRSQVTYEFRFRLNDSRLLKISDKLEVFRKILLDHGAGAKTNVGYGQFVASN
jgi:CRISPR-associated protein Cmr6